MYPTSEAIMLMDREELAKRSFAVAIRHSMIKSFKVTPVSFLKSRVRYSGLRWTNSAISLMDSSEL